MKILIIGHVEYGSDNAAALRLLEVARALVDGGHEVDVFEGMPATRQADAPAIARYATIHPASPPSGRLRRLLVKLGVGFGLLHSKLTRQSYDVVYCYGSELSWLIAGWLFARRSGARLVADVTELYGFEGMSASFSHFRTRIGTWIGLFAIIPLLTRGLAVPSHRFRRIMCRYHSKVIVLPPFFGTLPQAAAKLAPNIGRELSLVYAGNPSNKEQLALLFSALAGMPAGLARPIRFRLVGLNEAQLKQLLLECGATGLLQRNDIMVEALGRTDVHTARLTVARADFQVVIRQQSLRVNCGFPSKVSEAYRLGTPVISNLYSDMIMYLENAGNAFVIERDTPEELVGVLCRCVDLTSDTAERIMANARATGQSHFSAEAVAGRLDLLLS